MHRLLGKLHRKGNKEVYLGFFLLLWIASIVSFAFEWTKFRAGFVVHNVSPIDIFASSVARSDLVENVAAVVIVLIADGILVRNTRYAQSPCSLVCRFGAATLCGIIYLS